MNKLRLFKNQDDYIIDVSNDKIINVIGISGSGKSYITTEIGKIEAGALESTPITVRSVEIGSDNNIDYRFLWKRNSTTDIRNYKYK